MELPDALILSKIKKRNLYADEKSIEIWTTKPKRKYKLAGNVILEKYFFHILTTKFDACKKKLTLAIKKEHWENKIDGPVDDPHLQEDVSYCDLTKYELLEQQELLGKIKDEGNGFFYVAKLCLIKCNELQKLCDRKKMGYYNVSNEAKSIIAKGMLDNADEILLRLGLK